MKNTTILILCMIFLGSSGTALAQEESKQTLNFSLMSAAYTGDLDSVKKLLDEGAEIEAEDKTGATPLWFAAQEGHKEVVEFLLEKGAKIDNPDNNDATPLMMAAIKGHVEVMKLLLTSDPKPKRRSADVNAKDDSGTTPLIYAVKNNQKATVELLIEKKADPNLNEEKGRSALSYAVESGNKEMALLLLKNKANVNNRDNVDGKTPLMLAASRGDAELVQILIDKKADVNAANQKEQSFTAIFYAVVGNHISIAKLLLEKGARINVRDRKGVSLARYAVDHDRPSILSVLLEKGVDVESRHENNSTLLMIAAAKGRDSCLAALLRKGANVKAVDAHKSTPLHYAALFGHSHCAYLLLTNGAQLGSCDTADETPIDWALNKKHVDTAKVILGAYGVNFIDPEPRKSIGSIIKKGLGTIYYTNAAGIAIAIKFTEYAILNFDFGAKPSTFHLDYEQDTYVLRFMAKEGVDWDIEFLYSLKLLSAELRKNCFGGVPVEIRVCDENFRTLKTILPR